MAKLSLCLCLFALLPYGYGFGVGFPSLKVPKVIDDGFGVLKNLSPIEVDKVTSLIPELDIDFASLKKLVPSIDLKVEHDPSKNYSDTSLFPGYGDMWMFMPDGEGNPVKVNFLQAATGILPSFLQPKNIDKKITYHLYTRKNMDEAQIITPNDDSLSNSNFDNKKETKFVTHGWLSSGNSSTCQSIKNEYLKHNDYNVFIVDWYPISKSIVYPIPMLQVSPIAKEYAKFLDYLMTKGADPDKIHLIGHSLGAHVSGIAGKSVQKKLKRVTGLDPALPGFRIIAGITGGRLGKDSAKFVDVIHSCAGILGIDASIGHLDFYPNNGFPPQPGCSLTEYFEGCSHARSWKFFKNSIDHNRNFEGFSCSKITLFRHCDGSKIRMGDPAPSNATGEIYIQTLQQEPFVP